jgi:hypothetical protein
MILKVAGLLISGVPEVPAAGDMYRKRFLLPVNITIFRNGWCPAMNLVYERAKRASKEFEGIVEIQEYETTDREIIKEWGITDGLFINGKEVRTGPPPSYQKIRKKIEKKAKKVK